MKKKPNVKKPMPMMGAKPKPPMMSPKPKLPMPMPGMGVPPTTKQKPAIKGPGRGMKPAPPGMMNAVRGLGDPLMPQAIGKKTEKPSPGGSKVGSGGKPTMVPKVGGAPKIGKKKIAPKATGNGASKGASRGVPALAMPNGTKGSKS